MKSENVDVNRHIGSRLRLQRGKSLLSRREVGMWLDVSHQQIRNYEEGTNRLTVDALFVLSREMNVDPIFLFEGLVGPRSENSVLDSALADYILSSLHRFQKAPGWMKHSPLSVRGSNVLTVRLVETVAETEAGGSARRDYSGSAQPD